MPTTTGLATSFITFSRPGASGGGATVTDRDGKIKWAGHNLLPNSESFDASTWSKTNVTVAANAVVAPDSTTTADRITFTVSSGQAIYTTSVNPAGVNYTGRVWLKGSGDVAIRISNSIDQQFLTSITLTSTWTLYTVTGTFNTTAGSLLFGVGGVTAASVDVWGAHLYRSDMQMQLNPAQPAGMQSYYPTTPKNLLGYTEDFSNAAWVKTNMAAFGSGSVANAILGPNGLQTADKLVSSTANNYHGIYQLTTVTTGTYVFSFYAKAAEYSLVRACNGASDRWYASFNLGTGAVIAGTTGGSSYLSSAIASVGDGWYRCSVAFTNSNASTASTIVGYPAGATLDPYGASYTGDGTSGIYLWGAQLSDSASLDTYVPVYGAAVTSAAYYAPRLDFDPVTLAAKGLLVEEARTNYFQQSSAFDQSPWVAERATVTANTSATTAPDGTNTADKLVESVDNGSHLIGQSYTVTATVTASVYVKAAERSAFLFNGGNQANVAATFNLSTVAVSSIGSSVTATSITAVGGGWYRCSMTWANSGLVSPAIFLLNGGNTSYAGDGTSGLYLWGAMLENGAFPTSLIPTGSATATRTADVASVSTQAFPYSSSASSLVVSFTTFGSNASSGKYITHLSDGVATGLLLYQNSNSLVLDAYVNGSNASFGTATANAVQKMAIAYDGAANGAVLNGGSVTSVGTTATAGTKLSIGSSFSGTFLLSGYIRQITYIPRRLSNAEIISRTAA